MSADKVHTSAADVLEAMGRAVDTCNALLAALQLPVPPATHIAGLRSGITDLRDGMRKTYLSAGGEDWWNDAT